MEAAERLREQPGDADHVELPASEPLPEPEGRDRLRHRQGVQGRVREGGLGVADEQPVSDRGVDRVSPRLPAGPGAAHQGGAAAHHVVHDQCGPALDVADQGPPRHLVPAPVLLEEGHGHLPPESTLERVAERLGALGPSGVRGDHGDVDVASRQGRHVVRQTRTGLEVHRRDPVGVLERRQVVHVHGDHAVGAHRLEQPRHVPGGHRVPGLGLPVLPGVAQIGEDRREASGACVPQVAQEEEEAAELVVDRRVPVGVQGLHHVDVTVPD